MGVPRALRVRMLQACECRWKTSHACAVPDPCLHMHPGIAGLSTRSRRGER